MPLMSSRSISEARAPPLRAIAPAGEGVGGEVNRHCCWWCSILIQILTGNHQDWLNRNWQQSTLALLFLGLIMCQGKQFVIWA